MGDEWAHSATTCNQKSGMNATNNKQNRRQLLSFSTVLAAPACQNALLTSSRSTAIVAAASTKNPASLKGFENLKANLKAAEGCE
jgi:hypothetical protein